MQDKIAELELRVEQLEAKVAEQDNRTNQRIVELELVVANLTARLNR